MGQCATTPPLTAFRAARDLLLNHREDYDAARADFSWPELDEFNWALDWFDVIAAEHPDRIALRVVGDDGSDEAVSYQRMAARSSQVATWLRGLGVRRGDRVLLMLGNIVPLWEVMLAAMKLGAVIIPASTLLQPRGPGGPGRRGATCGTWWPSARRRAKFADVSGEWTRVVVGGDADGWHSYADAALAPEEFTPDGVTQADDPLLLYFTSGTTSQPKLVEHTQASYPVGHLSTMYWIGIKPGDVHLNISSPGWAKHAWSQPLRPVERAGHDPHTQPGSVQRRRAAGRDRRLRRQHVLRAADGVADAHPGRPVGGEHRRGCASAWPPASRSTRR